MNLFNNVKWVSLSQLIRVVCQVCGMIIFSRYLTPKEIGVMSLTLVVVNFVNILRDMGSSAAIIQKENITNELKSAIFTMNLLMGLIISLFIYIASHYISVFFEQQQLESTIRIIIIAVIFNSASSVHLAMMERCSEFKKVAIIESTSSISSLSIGLFFATHNYGVYSLVAQTVSYSIISSIFFFKASGWIPSLSFDLRRMKSIFNFSSNLVGFNFINYFSRNSDQLIIGKSFSASILGEYSLAYRLMLFPVQNITSVLTRSLYPVLSRLQSSPNDAFKVYLNTIKSISLIVPAMMLGLSAVSHEFTILVFGKQWVILPQILNWLSLVGILQALVSSTGSVFMSRGRTELLLYISLFNSVLQVGAFIIGSFYGIDTLVKLYLLANIIMFLPNMIMAVKTLSGSVIDFLLCLYKPLACSIIMFGTMISSGWLLSGMHFSLLTIFTLKVFIGVITYATTIIIAEPNLFNSLKVKLSSKKFGDTSR